MKKIIIAAELTEAEKNQVQNITKGFEVIYRKNQEVTPEDMRTVSAVIGNLSLRHFAEVPELEWVQLQSAGTDGYLKEGILPERVVLTNATGAFGESIAEYVLGAVLAINNHFPLYQRQQEKREWKEKPVYNLKGSTVVVLGFGDLGREIAKRMKAMGCTVYAVKRRPGEKPDYVDGLYQTEELERLLPLADVFVLALPFYPELYHMIDEKKLHLLKSDAIFVNVARGKLVDEETLVSLLKEEKIRAAVLDVFEKEPLPAESSLWDLPNVLVTPHCSGRSSSPMARETIGSIFLQNLEAFCRDRPLINRVDKSTGYCERSSDRNSL